MYSEYCKIIIIVNAEEGGDAFPLGCQERIHREGSISASLEGRGGFASQRKEEKDISDCRDSTLMTQR